VSSQDPVSARAFSPLIGPDLSGKGFGARVGPYNEFDKMHKKKQFSDPDYVSARKTLAEHNTHWPKSKEKVINDVWLTAFRWVVDSIQVGSFGGRRFIKRG
jgi:hypothetical protein